ncbi:hypothetical protein DI383_04790 [Flavobacteriaceae bacterium LYZ1037]|nr:hypothetical protein DI383_04790 [Flavobacteriaceae bacterium LYZ1037]
MKTYITVILLLFSSLFIMAQSYQFGIVHLSGNQFKMIATPDFDSDEYGPNANTDVSDVGFTLVLPAGPSHITNLVSFFPSRTFDLYDYDAAFIAGLGYVGFDIDVFQFNMPPGQTILQHTAGVPIDLVSFEVTNPGAETLFIMPNDHDLNVQAGNIFESFYNSDIDGPGNGNGTLNLYTGNIPGLESFNLETLSVPSQVLEGGSISVYPNPTSDYIHIATTYKIQQVEIYDILGKKVKQVADSPKINVNHLQAGIYLVKIFTDNGQITKKIIVE